MRRYRGSRCRQVPVRKSTRLYRGWSYEEIGYRCLRCRQDRFEQGRGGERGRCHVVGYRRRALPGRGRAHIRLRQVFREGSAGPYRAQPGHRPKHPGGRDENTAIQGRQTPQGHRELEGFRRAGFFGGRRRKANPVPVRAGAAFGPSASPDFSPSSRSARCCRAGREGNSGREPCRIPPGRLDRRAGRAIQQRR